MSKLGNLLVKEKTVDVEYPDCSGFIVTLAFLSREQMTSIRNQSTVVKTSKVTRQREEVLDSDRFLEIYAEKAIKGWKGLKVKYLPKLLAVDISSMNPEDEFAYSQSDSLELLKNSPSFDQWITDQMADHEQFSTKKRETETKN